jgi:hypothetical protein
MARKIKIAIVPVMSQCNFAGAVASALKVEEAGFS